MDRRPRRTSITQVKHYRLLDEIGVGGMGSVYEGIDGRDSSRVAIKILHPELVARDPTFRDRFEREAHIAALLRSPYTVHLLDFGQADGTYYLVMEFVDGHNLAKELEGGPLDPRRALRIAADIAHALEEAAARGVAHRDIKPENILLTVDGRVKVADFGVARQAGGGNFTMAGQFVGTPDFAAPEQFAGEADHRSDIYALGATLYCMLTGHPPFQGRSALDILRMHQDARVPMAPLDFLPDAVTNTIRRCLEKDPRDRYQSAAEVAGTLERALATLPPSLRGPGRPPALAAGGPPVDLPRTLAEPPSAQPPLPGPAFPSGPDDPRDSPTVLAPQPPARDGRNARAEASSAAGAIRASAETDSAAASHGAGEPSASEVAADGRVCPSCSTPVAEDMLFCGNCGASLAAPVANDPTDRPTMIQPADAAPTMIAPSTGLGALPPPLWQAAGPVANLPTPPPPVVGPSQVPAGRPPGPRSAPFSSPATPARPTASQFGGGYMPPRRSSRTPIVLGIVAAAVVAVFALILFSAVIDSSGDDDNVSSARSIETSTPTSTATAAATATRTALPAPTAKAGDVSYLNRFDANSILPIAQNGKASIDGGQLLLERPAAATAITSVEVPTSFPDIQIKMRAYSPNDTLQIACRGVGANMQYRANIRQGTQVAYIARWDGSENKLTTPTVSTVIPKDSFMDVSFICNGSTLALAVNGTTLATVTDTSYATGDAWVGIGTSGVNIATSARLDDVTVIRLR